MSEQEIKKQIEIDTIDWCDSMLQSEEDYDRFSHQSGRENQDKIATNRTVDEVKVLLMMSDRSFASHQDYKAVMEELERLRR